jgi:hypothetical protein
MALAISKHIEIAAGISIKAFLTESKKVTDAKILNKITKKEIMMRTAIPPRLSEIMKKIIRPH